MMSQTTQEAVTTSGLALSSVSLHIESLVPLASSSSQLKTSNGDVKTPESLVESQDTWMKLQVADRMQWRHGFRSNKKGGLVFLDADALKKQQGVVKEIMLQVGAQLLSGKLAVRISLPIRIFESRTLLERVADGWNYAPTLLTKASRPGTDPVERLKLLMAFVVGGLHFCAGQHKPFNPIVGETYEATYADGARMAFEHVSHHPVKSAFSLTGPQERYQLSGAFEFEAVSNGNAITNHQIGTVKIVFRDGQVVTYTMPQIKVSVFALNV